MIYVVQLLRSFKTFSNDFPIPHPYSANNNWETNFALSRSCESSPHAKKREIGETAPVRGDSMAYSCLLKNELLGTSIDDVKSVTEDRNENQSAGPMGNARRGLFKYQSPSKQVSQRIKNKQKW